MVHWGPQYDNGYTLGTKLAIKPKFILSFCYQFWCFLTMAVYSPFSWFFYVIELPYSKSRVHHKQQTMCCIVYWEVDISWLQCFPDLIIKYPLTFGRVCFYDHFLFKKKEKEKYSLNSLMIFLCVAKIELSKAYHTKACVLAQKTNQEGGELSFSKINGNYD